MQKLNNKTPCLFLITLLCYLISLSSCEKKTQWDLKTKNNDFIIVDGMLTDQKTSHIVRLTRPVENLNQTPTPVTGAIVSILDDRTAFKLTETPENSGIYRTNANIQGRVGFQYTLVIHLNDKLYSAKTKMYKGPRIPTLRYIKNDNTQLFHLTFVANPYNPNQSAMWEIELNWSKVNGYTTQNPNDCKARILFYTLSTMDVSEVFAPTVERILFPLGTTLKEKRYSLSPEHEEFIRAMISLTNWQGGLFDTYSSNIPTNISSGGAGFFSACSVDSLEYIINP